MPTQPKAETSAGTAEPTGAEKAAPLSPTEQATVRATDTADTSPRLEKDLSGKRLRAVMWGGATRVVVRNVDFADMGVKDDEGVPHDTVTFDWEINDGTLPVDPQEGETGISKRAAEALIRRDPTKFEWFGGTVDSDSE